MNAPAASPLLYVVDDDPAVLVSTARLLRAVGYQVKAFGSPLEMLGQLAADDPGCMLLDLRMPELSGLELQEHLCKTGRSIPIIFFTAQGDIPSTVVAMRRGAEDFLTKPVPKEVLLEAVRLAVEKHAAEKLNRERAAAESGLDQSAAALAAATAGAAESPPPPAPEAVREQLDKILASSDFAAAAKHARILRFVVEQSLAGKQPNQFIIGVEALDLPADFDPVSNPVVRVYAGRLRRLLAKYYQGPGAQDAVLIDMPVGGYFLVPRTRTLRAAVP